MGTDDVIQGALLSPPLTIFTVPKFELGRAAAHTMTALLGNPAIAATRTILNGRVTLRNSTARPAAARQAP